MQLHLDTNINNTKFADYNGLGIQSYFEDFKVISGRDGSLGVKMQPRTVSSHGPSRPTVLFVGEGVFLEGTMSTAVPRALVFGAMWLSC